MRVLSTLYCRVELVDYGRQQRATLRYYVTGQASAAATQPVLVYGKLTGDGSGTLAGPISDALRERVRAASSTYHFNVPRVLAWRPDLKLSLLEAIPGQGLIADALKALLRERGVGTLTVKKRGSAVEPEEVRRRVKPQGPHAATVLLTRVAGAPAMLIGAPATP